jgi:hypothetical protein
MHDTGVIAEDARGWRFLPAGAVGNAAWTRRRFDDSRWEQGTGPFVNDWEFRSRVGQYVKKEPLPESLMHMGASTGFVLMMSSQINQALCFRYRFTLPKELVQPDSQLKLELTSLGAAVTVWVNGTEVQPADKPKSGKREYWFPPRAPAPADGSPPPARTAPLPLVAGKNVLAVKVDPETPKGQAILKARLDAIRKPTVADEIPDEVTQKLVTSRAVVCDLCSGSPGQVPACVNACPHDAAMRVDARSEFPME